MGVGADLPGKLPDWLSPDTGLRWIDVGCGNGAFTDLLFRRCTPAEVQGIDPSRGAACVRTQPAGRGRRDVPHGRRHVIAVR